MMSSIISADFYKLRKNIAAWLLPAAAIVATLVTAIFIYFIDHGLTVEGGMAVSASDVFGLNPSGSAGVYALASISSVFAVLAVVFAGLFVSNEFATGTIRNALCIGKSRVRVYLSKLLVGGVMLLVTMLAATIVFVVAFTLMYGFGNGALLDGLQVFGLQFLYHLPYAALACMLAFLIQNNVFAVSVGIFCTIISGTLVDIFMAFDGLGWLARLIPNFYITRLADNLSDVGFIVQSVVACVAFVVVSAVIGCLVFKRRDIK
jgi:ABC-2 type transport system permease protein